MENKTNIQEEIVNEETVEVENPAVDDTKADPKQEEPKEKKGFFAKKEDAEKKKLQEEVAKLKDKYHRTSAEMQNMKRRMEEEKSNLLKYDGDELIKKLLPIVDNFERAISMDDANLEDEVSKFLNGFKMLYGNFSETLKGFEVIGKNSSDNTLQQVNIIQLDNNQVIAMVCTNKGIVENRKF